MMGGPKSPKSVNVMLEEEPVGEKPVIKEEEFEDITVKNESIEEEPTIKNKRATQQLRVIKEEPAAQQLQHAVKWEAGIYNSS